MKGVAYASWTFRDRKFLYPLCPGDPTRYRGESKVYSIRWRDHAGRWHVEAVSPNRRLAERRKVEIEDREENVRHRVLPPTVSTTGRPTLQALLDDWVRAIQDAGNQAGHAALYRRRADVLMQHVGACWPTELTREDVAAALAQFRRDGVPPPGGKGRPLSVESSNHYLTALKALTRWCVERRHLQADPLAGLRKLNADSHRTFERRPLTPEELDRLVAATATRRSQCAIPGPDRAVCYLVVAYTGFRLKEVSQLDPAAFRLSESPPVVQLPASKGKPPVVQVLPEAIVPRLRTYLTSKPTGVPLWHAKGWAGQRKASGTLYADLRAAGIERKDATGRVVNFHSLRTTFATWLAQSGVSIQHAQRLMRHSDPRLTIKHYTKLGDTDLAGQLNRLPKPAG